MKYAIKITCSDCTGVDPMGCGDGNPWHKLDPNNGWRVMTWDTQAEAEKYLNDHHNKITGDGAPWEAGVEEYGNG